MIIPIMNNLIILCIIVIISIIIKESKCDGYGGHDGYGHHEDYYDKHQPHPYKFGYEIEDGYGGKNSRHESGDGHGNVHGSYSLYDKDGRKRIVEYVADKKGFRAKIHSNEPGLATHNAANAYYKVEHHGYHGDDYHGDDHHHGGGYGKDDDYGYGHR